LAITPMAFTPYKPPFAARISLAIDLATLTSAALPHMARATLLGAR
jgi:hypothetical protein